MTQRLDRLSPPSVPTESIEPFLRISTRSVLRISESIFPILCALDHVTCHICGNAAGSLCLACAIECRHRRLLELYFIPADCDTMSLHRVSSMSSYEHVRGSSPARSEHRKMSFNPVGTWVPPAAKKEPVGAFEVSKTRRLRMRHPPIIHNQSLIHALVQVAAAVVYCLFAAGVVFGYAALKPVLVREGVYGEYCSEMSVDAEATTCYEQEIRYTLQPPKHNGLTDPSA